MFIMDYTEGKGWDDARIVPYEPITLDPAAVIFHYGQTVFEGLKAYHRENGSVGLFRPEKNIERLNQSSDRLSMREIDHEIALEALKKITQIEKDWVPTATGNRSE